ncbi:cellulose synthase-like protein G3 [Solanum verrucosum]|uniref:cellulose synthase-like protein G3 n=1 Tax=Solanum verrucosum TaxID=315347 RepID=UPI0020D0F952|nr:cellulose synthase-like protein G3 [Solanum verrucosum]
MGAPYLNTRTLQQPRAIFSRIHILLHFSAILGLLYYRIKNLLQGDDVSIISWGLITISEVIFTIIWLVTQSFRWHPVARSVMPENLPADSELPGVDVFICTADPTKEPVLEVMNTVLSAMSLDYPPEKLSVYLSDDGGATVTLYAMKEACGFARVWVPFCRKYGVKTICPDAFFSSFGDDERLILRGNEFKNEEKNIKAAYEVFKKNVEKASSVEGSVRMDRPPYIEVIHDDKESKLPQLVYMSRERRPSSPHRFKAGALNALLRVSGVMSNAPYMLVLDCDMYCNDPSSAKQAMCFHLDQNISTTLSYVQFPQTFYNVSKNDIYDAQSRSAYKNKYQGMDGVGGTVCAGTGYYLKKEALYSTPINQDDMTTLFLKAQSEYKWESQLYQSEESLQEAEEKFGASRKFINSINSLNDQRNGRENVLCDETIDEAKTLASCTFEENTRWGKEN